MKILPYPQIPQLICYHNKAFPIGIIQANSLENITKWLCTKYINTVYNPNSPQNKFDLAMRDNWGNWEGITTQQVFSIKKDLISLINVDLLNMIRTFLDHGCYIGKVQISIFIEESLYKKYHTFIKIIVSVEEKFECEIPDSKLLIGEMNTANKIVQVLKDIEATTQKMNVKI